MVVDIKYRNSCSLTILFYLFFFFSCNSTITMYDLLEYLYYAPEPDLNNNPNDYYSLDPSRFRDTHGLYRPTQMIATESAMGRWQDIQRTPQYVQFKAGITDSKPIGSNQNI